jgi:hypothetical protein
MLKDKRDGRIRMGQRRNKEEKKTSGCGQKSFG